MMRTPCIGLVSSCPVPWPVRLGLWYVVLAMAVLPVSWGPSSVAQADGRLPTLEVRSLAEPVLTTRLFSWALVDHPDGSPRFVGQFMNFKGVARRALERHTAEATGLEYETFADTDARPDAEWVVLNLDTGDYHIDRLPGFHTVQDGVRADNGRVFFIGDHMHLYFYDPEKDRMRIFGQVAEFKPYQNDRVFYRLLRGPDGMIYGTTQAYHYRTALFQLNPDTLEFQLFTDLGTGDRSERLTYGYYLGVDPPWAYVAVGQADWELVAFNTETRESHILAKAYGDRSRVVVRQNDEAISADITRGYDDEHVRPDGDLPRTEGHRYYADQTWRERVWLADGQMIPAERTEDGELPFTPLNEKDYPQIEWQHTEPRPATELPEVDTDRLGISGRGEGRIYFRHDQDEPWQHHTFDIKHTEPTNIHRMILLPDGTLFGGVVQYHGFFRYDPRADTIESYGRYGSSSPEIIADEDGKVYFVGYPNMNLSVYDPAEPWNARRQPSNEPGTNPRLIGYFGSGTTEAHHSRFIEIGPDGRIYLLGQRERWARGSGLGYYDPATDDRKGLPEAMSDLDPQGMVVLGAAERVVVSGRFRGEADDVGKAGPAVLYVFDLDLELRERLSLGADVDRGGSLASIDRPERFLGLVRTDDGAELYLYDLDAKTIRTSRTLDAAPRGGIITRPSDNSRWLVIRNVLYRIHPRTLDLRAMARLSQPLGDNVIWDGDRLFGTVNGEIRGTINASSR